MVPAMMYKVPSLRLAALAVASTLVTASPAAAQFSNLPLFPGLGPAIEEPALSGRQVLQILSRRGFEPLTGAQFNGDAYVVDAISPRGEAVRLVVDAFDGRVLRRVNLDGGFGGARGYEPPPPPVSRERRPDFGDDEIVRPAPRQPRQAPSARVEPPPVAPRAVTPAPERQMERPSERPTARAPAPRPSSPAPAPCRPRRPLRPPPRRPSPSPSVPPPPRPRRRPARGPCA
jgi:hypothetical protein